MKNAPLLLAALAAGLFLANTNAYAQRIIAMRSTTDSINMVVYNPYTDACSNVGYTDFTTSLFNGEESYWLGSSTINPANGNYFMRRVKFSFAEGTDSVVREGRIRMIDSYSGEYQDSPYFDDATLPFQLEFSLRDGKLYGLDFSNATRLRLMHVDLSTNSIGEIVSHEDTFIRSTGGKWSAFDSDNNRYIYATNSDDYPYVPQIVYINVENGEKSVSNVRVNAIEGFDYGHFSLYETQYDEVNNRLIAIAASNNQPLRIVAISEDGEGEILYTFPYPHSLGSGSVIDQATGRYVVLTYTSHTDFYTTVINARSGEFLSQINSDKVIGDLECDNTSFAFLRYRATSTVLSEEQSPDLSLAPNPSTGLISIRSNQAISYIELYSMLGERSSSLAVNNTNEASLSLKGMPSGSYIATIRFADGSSINKQISLLP